MFSMTSLVCVSMTQCPYVFKISGQLYHWIGSLCPPEGEPPRFLQLYIYDTDNEIDNCLRHFGNENSTLRRDIVEGLIELLDAHNTLVQLFRTVREKYLAEEVPDFKVRLYNVIGTREYELPKGDMLGAIVYEAGPETKMDYDIIIAQRSDGYSKDMKLFGCTRSASAEGRRLTMKAYYSYYLHDHVSCYNFLSRTGQALLFVPLNRTE
ncbi:hypothetical protein Tco_1469859 [Tanacetum coccineum]